MIDYIKGEIVELSPAHIVLEAANIGYLLNISLGTYSELNGKTIAKLYVYEAIREDAHTLFGFLNKEERDLFLLLISVSGVGANTARVILSSLAPNELQNAILTGNVSLLKSVKGIGAKTAERIIVDLKDKVAKVEISSKDISIADNILSDEAVAALVMLGFAQAPAQKAVRNVIEINPQLKIEEIIKQALKLL
ncbi:ATP-dependent DNA helicase RuvA [Porphyromonadaceae bacterium COT-184 OH4590]|nr:ATP-dependent DNA helicase RuvA [Porphyromonadaceae bacterium COT-184 OH4590]MDO4726412.1 Holliday junction branch migration protein RuvA [Porphyromonadaceae bacterium]